MVQDSPDGPASGVWLGPLTPLCPLRSCGQLDACAGEPSASSVGIWLFHYTSGRGLAGAVLARGSLPKCREVARPSSSGWNQGFTWCMMSPVQMGAAAAMITCLASAGRGNPCHMGQPPDCPFPDCLQSPWLMAPSWQTPLGHRLQQREGLCHQAANRRVSLCQGGGEQQAELVTSLQGLGAGTCWVILMTGGGHFAGAVFRG